MPNFLQLEHQWEVLGPIGDAPGMSEVVEVARGELRAVVKRVQKVPGGNRDLLVADLGHCRNVLQFDEIFETENEFLLRMPKAEESLNHHLTVNGPMDETAVLAVLTDITEALEDMGKVVVHRDIKPQNILLHNKKWHLADFGIARYTEDATNSHL